MPCKIIAEIGWNHMGDMQLAKEMVSAASESGADYVKFQTWSTKNLKNGPWDNDGRKEIYEKAELTRQQHCDLIAYCQKCNILFLTSIFNNEDADWLINLGINIIKVPSHEVYNKKLLSAVNGGFKTVIVSTGAAKWEEVRAIPQFITKSDLVLMHCVAAYPCPSDKVNLPRINALKELVEHVGYSGHFFGIEDAVAALSYKVAYIEKHFTIDRNLPGRDNKFAILPQHLKSLVEYRDINEDMNKNLGLDLQTCEQDIFTNYRGRWSV